MGPLDYGIPQNIVRPNCAIFSMRKFMPCEKEPCNDPEIWGFKQTNQHSKYTHFEGPSCQESVLVPAKAVYNICSLSTVATLEGGFKLTQQTTSYCSYCALQVGCQAASCKVYVNYTPHNSTLDHGVLFCAVCTLTTNLQSTIFSGANILQTTCALLYSSGAARLTL